MKKRVLSLFMALALCLTLLPTAALAEENTTEPSTQLTEPTPVPQEPKTPDQGENTETPNQPEEPSQDEPPAADEQPGVQSEPAPQAAEVPAENAVAQVGNVNYANITDEGERRHADAAGELQNTEYERTIRYFRQLHFGLKRLDADRLSGTEDKRV